MFIKRKFYKIEQIFEKLLKFEKNTAKIELQEKTVNLTNTPRFVKDEVKRKEGIWYMDYIRWSQEYFENAQKVKEDMDRLKLKLKHTKGDEARTIRENLITLRTMYLDCMKAYEILALRGGVHIAA